VCCAACVRLLAAADKFVHKVEALQEVVLEMSSPPPAVIFSLPDPPPPPPSQQVVFVSAEVLATSTVVAEFSMQQAAESSSAAPTASSSFPPILPPSMPPPDLSIPTTFEVRGQIPEAITDSFIESVSVSALNRCLKARGADPLLISCVKLRRRTLKNRVYSRKSKQAAREQNARLLAACGHLFEERPAEAISREFAEIGPLIDGVRQPGVDPRNRRNPSGVQSSAEVMADWMP
jgi:hypothetical protein